MQGVDFKLAAAKPPQHKPFRSQKGRTTIGVLDPCYGSSHVIYGLDTPRYVHETLPILPLKRFDKKTTFFQFTPFVLDLDVPLVHSWNAVPLNKNFIVSFELELPRYLHEPSDQQIRFALSRLAGPRCKRILALSDYAARTALAQFEAFGFARLADKLDLFRGAIDDPMAHRALPPRPTADFAREPLRAIVIGTELFRKGGMYAIKAFEQLRAAGRDVRLTLVGKFEDWSYAFREAMPDAEAWRARARENDWIDWRGPIPNAEVFPELRRHHLCLYPSLDESLGWLPIEAQMIEVPVVGNRVCAYPEFIAHGETGWLVDLPTHANGRWSGIDTTPELRRAALDEADRLIPQGIVDCVEAVFADPSLLDRWGRAGREKMLAMYGMAQASRRLETIYDEVLGA